MNARGARWTASIARTRGRKLDAGVWNSGPTGPYPLVRSMKVTKTAEVEAVYREHGPRLWRAIYASTGDRDVASDSVGEAFTQAMARGEAIESLADWVWRVAFIIARAEMKQRRHALLPFREAAYEPPDTIPHVFKALSELPANQRLAVVLHDYADRKTSEIARILEISQGTVYVHLSRGRRRLRQLLGDDDDE